MAFVRLWIKGKCDGDADFISEDKVCYKCGMYIKLCSINEFKEVSIEGPFTNIECICSCNDLGLLAVANHDSSIYVINYPNTDVLAHWEVKESSVFIQMCFAKNDYLLTLEGLPNYNLTFWNWKTATKLKNILHAYYSSENAFHCFLSTYPAYRNSAVFQQGSMVHFYEIENLCHKVSSEKGITVYLPEIGDEDGSSMLNNMSIEDIEFFDKMHSDSWGIHSELLDKMPLKVFSKDLSDFELVELYDLLRSKERLKASCHCWMPNEKIVIACVSGTVLLLTMGDLKAKILHWESDKQCGGDGNFISCMALNRDGLYVSTCKGDVYLVHDIDNWLLKFKVSIEESPIVIRFSPNYEQLLFVNDNGSIILYNTNEAINSVEYLVACTDNSPVVGIFIGCSYCITAKSSGLIETWDLSSGGPLSTFELREEIECMEVCPTCIMLLLSTKSSLLYAIDFTNMRTLKIVEIIRPSEKAIQFIKCENRGDFAILVSYDYYVFICCMLKSRLLEIQGYFLLQYDIKDIAIFTKGLQDVSFVSLLGEGEYERDFIVNFILPGGFRDNYKKYWENLSGVLSKETLKFRKVELEVYCSSIAAHSSLGILICLPIEGEIVSVPYEKFDFFNLKEAEKCCDIKCRGKKFKMILSLSHTHLLSINEIGELVVRDTESFKIICDGNFIPFTRSLAFMEDIIIAEGFNNIIICFKLAMLKYNEEKSWTSLIKSRQKEENEILSKMEPQSTVKLLSWVRRQCLTYNKDALQESLAKKEKIKNKFEGIKRKLQALAKENLSMPQEHQIQSEEFILDDNIKEQMLKSREKMLEAHKLDQRKMLLDVEKDVSDIHKECIENMMVQGKTLRSFSKGSLLYNYSIPVVSENDKNAIRYSFKKIKFEQQLQNIELKREETIEFDEELNFEEPPLEINREAIGKKFRKHPFQLQSQEERMDYVHILKFIVLKKRLGFNRLFDDIANLRKDTVKKIKDINSRIKDILLLIEEEKSIWEPEDESDDNLFEVSREEIENASKLVFKKDSVEFKGLATSFLDDEWVAKRRICPLKKYQIKLKKENIQRLKKEMDKKLKEIDGLVYNYENKHANLVQEKLLWDTDINQDELQIYLLLFSVSNFSNFRRWEIYNKGLIEDIENQIAERNKYMRDIETKILHFEELAENILSEMKELDAKVRQISKLSRNKQAFLEAYDQRPEIKYNVTLNPYKIIETQSDSPENLFQDMNASKNKPQKVPMDLWKQLCSFRERKFRIESDMSTNDVYLNFNKTHLQKVKDHQNTMKKDLTNRKEYLQKIHKMVNRSSFETPMMLSVAESNLEMKYPDDLNFKKAIFLKRFHVESLNCLIANAGRGKLDTARKISKAHYQIQKNDAKVRIDKLKVRDARKEIEVIKSIPLTKDIQKIISDPKGFSLQDKIDALEKSKQMEMDEILKQINHVTERISNIDIKKGIFEKSINEKKKEMKTLKGDIAELRKIERIKKQTN